MMYRSGWGLKDDGQCRILAIDISKEGFEWALINSLLSHQAAHEFENKEEWRRLKEDTPVRIQWDPERDLNLEPLEHRSIQVGLTGEAVLYYTSEWIENISEMSELALQIQRLVKMGDLERASALLPTESEYPLSEDLILGLQMSE